MRYISMLLCIFICIFTVVASDCSADESSTGVAQVTSIMIRGNAILRPVNGAEINLFHYGSDGSEIEIIAVNAPVITSSSGAFEFQVNLEDVENIDTPLLLRCTGGIMGEQPAPELEALIPDPYKLFLTDGEITLHLSAASSLAARMLSNQILATGYAPAIQDAEACIETVEKALDVDLTQDPAETIQAVAIENMNVCEDLDLFNSPENNSIVKEYLEFVAVQLNSSYGILGNAAEDGELSNFGSGALAKLFYSKKKNKSYRLKLWSLRKNVHASPFDKVIIFISLRDFWGKIIKKSHGGVKLEVVHGEGVLSDTHLKLKNGRARVFLASHEAGEVVVMAKYKRHDGSKITSSIVINFIDANGSGNPPVADAGQDQTVPTGSEIILDGSNSSDPNGYDLTYAWTIVDAPQGSSATLSDPATVDPSFIADLEGTYNVELVVDNGTMNSDPDTVTITAVEAGNSTPVADAGPDQQVDTGDTVTLDGSGSSDADGDSLSYTWTIVDAPQGSSAALSDATIVNPTFTADVDGTYTIKLVVNDGTADSNPDTVTITTDSSGNNSAPTADAGPDQQVSTGTTVSLDGTGSSDPDGDSLTYKWTITDAPQGSSAALSDSTVADPDFTTDLDGTYTIKLVVNDGTVDSNPDTVTITADSSGNNSAPVADAGDDQQVSTNTTVMLDGSGSSDADGDSLSYTWTLVSAPQDSNAVLSDPTTSKTVFFTPDVEGTYKVQLIVNDGAVDSSPDTVTVTATDSGPDGEALYIQYCKSCHGDNGTTNGDLTDMTADELMSLLPHYGVTSDAIGGQEGAEAISDYIAN